VPPITPTFPCYQPHDEVHILSPNPSDLTCIPKRLSETQQVISNLPVPSPQLLSKEATAGGAKARACTCVKDASTQLTDAPGTDCLGLVLPSNGVLSISSVSFPYLTKQKKPGYPTLATINLMFSFRLMRAWSSGTYQLATILVSSMNI
jgi:hypothetical protein